MSSLKNEDGQRLTDQSDILDETVNYYTNLYTADKELNKTEREIFLNNVHRQLSESDKRELESNLSSKELKEALDDAENEKSPWCDGLPYEFYKQSWPLLGNDLLETVTYSLSNKQALPVTQRTSVIALLFKGDDRELLKYWRPISLLCTDYKILTTALVNRMKKNFIYFSTRTKHVLCLGGLYFKIYSLHVASSHSVIKKDRTRPY